MKVINPIAVTDSILTSSTVAEPASGETAWVSAGTYVLGDFRIRTTTHRVYLCVQASTGRTALPEADTAYWLDYGPTLKWAMFDGVVNTQSTATTTLTVTLVPGLVVTDVAFGELVGSTITLTQKTAPGGTVVYSKTLSLDGSNVYDWFSYFFEPSAQKTTVLFTDLLPYATGELTVTIAGTGTVKCGVMSLGQSYQIGAMQYGAAAGITDYSTKTTDVYGTTKIVKRAYSKRLDAKLFIDNTDLNRIHTLLSNLRSTPCVWVGVDDATYANTSIIFGYYKDFSLEITYPMNSLCSLQIEGLI